MHSMRTCARWQRANKECGSRLFSAYLLHHARTTPVVRIPSSMWDRHPTYCSKKIPARWGGLIPIFWPYENKHKFFNSTECESKVGVPNAWMINPMSIRLENVKVERQFVLRWSSYQCICSELLDSQFIHQTWASERARYLAERKGKKERPRARIRASSSLMANWQCKFFVGLLVAISINF